MEAEGHAAAIRAQGEAEAEIIFKKGEAEAKAMNVKAEAYQEFNQAAIVDKLITSMPEIVRALAAPLANVDKITIVSTGNGDTAGMNKITGDMTKMAAQIPALFRDALGHAVERAVRQGADDRRQIARSRGTRPRGAKGIWVTGPRISGRGPKGESMALLERVSTLIRANLNDLVDKAEDPEKMIKQVILDMQNQLLQVKTQVAISIADQHVLEKKLKETKRSDGNGCAARRWPSTSSDDALARAAVERAMSYRNPWPRASASRWKIRSAGGEPEDRAAQAATEAGGGASQERHADRAAPPLARAGQGHRRGPNHGRPIQAAAFDRMKNKVQHSEAAAQAKAELLADNVEDQFKAMEKQEGRTIIEAGPGRSVDVFPGYGAAYTALAALRAGAEKGVGIAAPGNAGGLCRRCFPMVSDVELCRSCFTSIRRPKSTGPMRAC
jgi:phage shock protein A